MHFLEQMNKLIFKEMYLTRFDISQKLEPQSKFPSVCKNVLENTI